MITLRTWWLPGLALLAGLLGWTVALVSQGGGRQTPVLGLPALITLLVVALISLGFGLRIRRDWDRLPAERMDPLAAARILVLAQSGAFAGALFGGWHAGVLVQVLARAVAAPGMLRDCVLLVGGGVVLVVVGILVERWCRIPPEDEAGGTNGRQDGRGGGGVPRRRTDPEEGYARARHGA
ncbi:DUF3180 domain-containing protein [Micrococcus luteus]